MPKYTKSIVLDVNAINKHQCVDAKQFDDKSRFLKVMLTANGEPVTIETGTTAMFRAVKPDKKSVCNAAQINSDGTVTVELTQQALACKGVVEADVSLVGSDGKVLSTASFFLQVQEAPLGNNVASESELLIFQQLADKTAESAAKGAEAAASVKKDAETAESARTEATEANENVQEIAKSLEQTVKDANTATSEALSAAEKANEAASSVENVPNDLKLTDRILQLTANGEAVGGGITLPDFNKFELWNDITLAEDATNVTMSKTDSGAPLKIKRLFILFAGNTSGNGPITLRYNAGMIFQLWKSVTGDKNKVVFWVDSEKLKDALYVSHYPSDFLINDGAPGNISMQGLVQHSKSLESTIYFNSKVTNTGTQNTGTSWIFGGTSSGEFKLKAGSRILVWGVQDDD